MFVKTLVAILGIGASACRFAAASPAVLPDGWAALHASSPRLPSNSLSARSTQISYSENWAGAALNTYPAGTFKSVTGTFTVPTPTKPSGPAAPAYTATAWVGIDGDTCGSAILQVGIGFVVSNTSAVSYYAWYEWWPANPLALSININPGDSVTLSVAATSTTTGMVTIENNTSGKSVSQNVSSTAPLCQQNAEWILEAYVENGDDVPFADFHSVKFTKASAGLLAGGSVGPAKAAVLGIEQSGTTLATASVASSAVTITYV